MKRRHINKQTWDDDVFRNYEFILFSAEDLTIQ